MKRRSAFLDSQRVIGGGFTAHERQLRRALRRLMLAADKVIADDAYGRPVDYESMQDLTMAALDAGPILEPKRK